MAGIGNEKSHVPGELPNATGSPKTSFEWSSSHPGMPEIARLSGRMGNPLNNVSLKPSVMPPSGKGKPGITGTLVI